MDTPYQKYLISTDKTRLNRETIYTFLQQSYWAKTRTYEQMEQSLEHSLCFGVYDGDRQIAFARAVTDYATMFWLCDVFVDDDYRGQGIGKKLMEAVTQHEVLKNLNGVLGTADAHGLYEQFGFTRNPERAMVRRV
ncbi:GNAT family N-acetyltransferase [Gorillibacterium sp. CAU 1737]|uniref:GNAT family N-acetyltransferase n=1 Tax=Gorillibacterium sp. CAU 1737 TaxID=3140362 RepID=UPI00325FEA93